ncbi:MAG: hypothetical protein QF637_11320 [Acidimicrobiales bacterium]|nr:hypothetical protein [Acidimicrobiales bacterium]
MSFRLLTRPLALSGGGVAADIATVGALGHEQGGNAKSGSIANSIGIAHY